MFILQPIKQLLRRGSAHSPARHSDDKYVHHSNISYDAVSYICRPFQVYFTWSNKPQYSEGLEKAATQLQLVPGYTSLEDG